MSFQWLENLLQQITWVLIDPNWKNDPREETAGLWFRRLLDFVSAKYVAYVDAHAIEDAEAQKKKFKDLIDRCAVIADARNRLIHSTFIEIKAAGEFHGLLQSKIKKETGVQDDHQFNFDQEHLTEKSFEPILLQIAEVGFALGLVHRQLIAWQGKVKPK